MTRWIDSLLPLRMGNLSGAPLHHPKHMNATLSTSSSSGCDGSHSCRTHAAQRSTTAAANMSAFSAVGDVFAHPEFSAPGNSFLWGLDAPEEVNRERTGFLIMPNRPCEWRVDSHGCHKFNNADLALGVPRHHGSLSRLPSPAHHQDAGLRQHYAQRNKLSKDGLRAKPPDRSEGRDDVDDRDVCLPLSRECLLSNTFHGHK